MTCRAIFGSITFLTALLQGQKLSIYQEPWIKLGWMACITIFNVLLYILKLSTYPDSRTMIKVDMKHSKCTCELVLLQANINRTWNLDRWHVLHFSLPYFRDSCCPTTQILWTWSKLIWNTANAVLSLCYCKRTSSATETWIDGVYYISRFPTSRDSKLSIYQDSKNQLQVDLKHSKCSCEPVLLQANINNTWNLDRWYVLHFSRLYSMDKSCPSPRI